MESNWTKFEGKTRAVSIWKQMRSETRRTLVLCENLSCVPICPKGKVYNLLCTYWHPPCVKITSLNRDATVGEKCVINLIEVNSHRNKKPKKSGGKGSIALLKNSEQ